MTDGVTKPHVGDRLTYTVTLADRDSIALDGRIRMTAPPGLSDLSATSGDLVGRELTWPTEIPSGGTTSLQFTGIVAGSPGRLAATVCAYVGTGGQPIACASDLDQATAAPIQSSRLIAIIIGVVVLLIALGGALFLMRRRRAGTASVTPPTSHSVRARAHAR